MFYYRSRARSKFRFRLPWQILLAGFFALVIFCAGLFYLRSGQDEDIVKNFFGSFEDAESALETKDDSIAFLPQESAVIKNLSDGAEIGAATRGAENSILYFTIKVSLPVIDRETEFYEVWLMRQVPFDFISVGEMTTNDSGEFVLEWAGEAADRFQFNKVVITREAKDGNSAPANKVAEGAFLEYPSEEGTGVRD